MTDEQAYKGLWWLPGDESDKLSGTLTVTKGEASLELLGHFGYEILYETETERVGSGSLARGFVWGLALRLRGSASALRTSLSSGG